MIKPYRIVISLLLLALCISGFQVLRIRRQLKESETEPATVAIHIDRDTSSSQQTLLEISSAAKQIEVKDSAIPIAETSTDLSIFIAGVRPHRGELHIAVFDDPLVFPDRTRALRVLLVSPDHETVRARLAEIPQGDYAVAVFQDSNGDGLLNRNAFGIPTERYGFSNDARGRFGPPTYTAAAVKISDREASPSNHASMTRVHRRRCSMGQRELVIECRKAILRCE